MFTKDRIGRALFTVLWLAIAKLDYDREKPLHPEFLALIFLAIMPWALRWLGTLVKSLKVGGMELTSSQVENLWVARGTGSVHLIQHRFGKIQMAE